jgi:cell division protein ZapE
VEALERCAQEWSSYQEKLKSPLRFLKKKPALPLGVYMFGGVGRGKSFLMDCFYNAVPVKDKTRLHFHEFMRAVHRELREIRQEADPLDEVARRIARRYRLICFDEFHVSDIADAMILERLLHGLFDNGVAFVMTSNYRPDGLYPDGLHRESIGPFCLPDDLKSGAWRFLDPQIAWAAVTSGDSLLLKSSRMLIRD